MRITILQTNIKWARQKENMIVADRLISTAPPSDLFVLPEMWSTGFITNPKEMAEISTSQKSLDWMIQISLEKRCAVCGSIPIKTTCGEYRNRQYFVKPNGKYSYYDKHHLFTYGGEGLYYKAGTERMIAEYKGARFLMQTCYDLRFPVWMRCKEDYDAIIIVANWPESRQNAWQILTRARAIENQCYVIAANRTGRDAASSYVGGSAIIDAWGYSMIQANKNKEQTITADIDIDELRHFRSKFPVLRARDMFNINQNDNH